MFCAFFRVVCLVFVNIATKRGFDEHKANKKAETKGQGAKEQKG
jgi:hypothetical protein